MTCRILICLKTIWCFFPCRKAVGNISFFFILLVFQVSFSFLDDAIVAEDDTGSDKKKTLQNYNITKTK